MRSSKTVVLPALSLAWLIILVIMFGVVSHWDFVHEYVLPNPFPLTELVAHVSPGQYVFNLAAALLAAALFSTCCVTLGLIVLWSWHGEGEDPFALGTTAFLVGEVICSIIFLAVIVLYKLTPLIVAIVFALSFLLGFRKFADFLRTLPSLKVPVEFRRREKILLGLAIFSALSTLLYTSSILGYDAVVQYFSQPKLLALIHTPVLTYPQDPFLVSSLHSEILYSALIELFGDQAARMLSWVNGAAILLLGLAIGKETGITAKARLWLLALLLTSTAFVDVLGDGKVELISTAPLLAGVYWMVRSARTPTKPVFVLIGFLLGFAIIARPYNIFLVPLFVVLFYAGQLWLHRRERGFRWQQFMQAAIWMGPPLLAMGAFHLLQNWLWLGNPLAPLASSKEVSASVWQWQFDPRLLNVYRLLYPIVASFANSPQSLGNISPFFVGSLPFLLIGGVRKELRESSALLLVGAAGLVTLLLWLAVSFTVVEIRYVFFLWVLFFLIAAQILDVITRSPRQLPGVLPVILVSLLLLYMGVRSVIISLATYAPVDGSGQAHCHDLNFCTFLEPLNASALPGERVLVLNAYRYYLRPDLFACSSRANEYGELKPLAQAASPDFWTQVYKQGFRYVTYETNYATFHTHFGALPPSQTTPPWLHITELSATPDGQEKIFRLDAKQPPMTPLTQCQANSSGVWQIVSGNLAK